MIVRSAPRFVVSLLVAFSGDQNGVGVIRNLSINGCCISSGTVVKAGESLNLEFHPLDDGPVILIDLAEVRWATAWEFGAVFQSLLLDEQRRLLQFITTLPSA
ncbi:MAG: PilZ domain-containing protein [Nitrospirota bacterium]|nr:PilZ domain-containing protein [Nitrospirota bacterium]